MKKKIHQAKALIFIFCLLSTCLSLDAQVSTYVFTQQVGTYTAITGGTVLGTTANDDNNFNAQNIGFTFTYNGTAYTQLSVNTNGFIVMGATAVSSYSSLSSGTSNNVIAALGRDLQGQTGSELRIETTGSAPNRTCVVQWATYRKYSATGDNYNFQIRLSETTNQISVVYGTMTNGASSGTNQIGLRGAANTDYNNRKTTTNWSATVAGTANNSTCTLSSTVYPASGQTYTWSVPVCTGPPTIGAAQSSTSMACSGVNFTLSLASGILPSGLTFQWQSSPDGITWVDITGATSASLSTSQTAATYYHCNATCSAQTTTSSNVQVGLNSFLNCYCSSSASSALDEEIYNVTLGTLNNTSTCSTTGATGSVLNKYSDFSAVSAPQLVMGYTHTVNVNIGTCGGSYTTAFRIFIDWNQDADFADANETVYTSSTFTSSSTGVLTTASIIVPTGIPAGNTKMRVVASETSTPTGIPYCGTYNYGETEDYTVNVIATPAQDVSTANLSSPISTSCHSANETVSLYIKNPNPNPIDLTATPVTVSCAATGANPQTFSPVVINTGTLASGASQLVTFTTNYNMTTSGTYTFNASVSMTGDGYAGNDAMIVSPVYNADITSLPYTQDFETNTNGWSIQQLSGTGNWASKSTAMTNPVLSAASGSTYMYFNSYNFSSGTISRLTTPCINLTTATNPYLEFKMSQDNAYSSSKDQVDIRVSTDGGTTWGAVLLVADRYNSTYSTAGWLVFRLCLSQYAGSATVKIAFDAQSGYGTNIGLDDVKLLNNPPAIAGTLSAQNNVFCSGNSTLIALAGYTADAFQWASSTDNINFTNINGATNDTLLTGVLTDTTYYKVKVTNGICYSKDSTTSFTITVKPTPVVNLGPDVNQCATSLTLNAQNAGATYLWNTAATTQTISPTASGLYYVDVTNAGCTQRDSINITLKAMPTVNLGTDITQCGGTILLDAQNTGSTYLWNTTAASQTLAVTTSGLYYVDVTNSSGCTWRDSINITLNAMPVLNLGKDTTLCGGTLILNAQNNGAAYLWNTSATTQTLTVTGSGLYYVDVTNTAGCTKRDSIDVTMGTMPVVNLGQDIIQCGGTLQLDAQNPGATYVWSDASVNQTLTVSNSGLYFVDVSYGAACTQRDSINVSISAGVSVDLGADTSSCGGIILLDAQNTGSSYLWNDNSTSSILVVTTSGTYYVTVTDPLGCTGKDTIQISLNSLPAVNLGSDIIQCGGTVNLNAGTTSGASYLWNDASTNQTLAVSATGTYYVTVSTGVNCTASDTVHITINAVPAVSLTLTQNSVCVNSAVVALAGGTPAGGVYSGTTISGSNFIPSATGTFVVTYTYTGANNCSGTATDNMVVNPCVGIAENTGLGELQLYPNPTCGDVTLTLDGSQGKVIAELYSAAGDLVKNETLAAGTTRCNFSLAESSNGMYFLKLRSDNGFKILKIVKQ